MSCCAAANEFFDEAQARSDLRRYRRRGPLPSAKKLLRAIGSVEGKSILDIGGGVGAITHGVLSSGAQQVTAVDASQSYLQAMLQEAERQGHAERITTNFGDFVAIAGQIEKADVATLDRVLCCYPDVESLLMQVSQRTDWRIGLVFPRSSWWSRLGIWLFNVIQIVRRNAFRVFYHSPAHVDALLQSASFEKIATDRTFIWQIAVYEHA